MVGRDPSARLEVWAIGGDRTARGTTQGPAHSRNCRVVRPTTPFFSKTPILQSFRSELRTIQGEKSQPFGRRKKSKTTEVRNPTWSERQRGCRIGKRSGAMMAYAWRSLDVVGSVGGNAPGWSGGRREPSRDAPRDGAPTNVRQRCGGCWFRTCWECSDPSVERDRRTQRTSSETPGPILRGHPSMSFPR